MLANVTFTTIPAGFSGAFQQGFSVDFAPAETGGLPQPAPNVRPKSGESGYALGAPILAGCVRHPDPHGRTTRPHPLCLLLL